MAEHKFVLIICVFLFVPKTQRSVQDALHGGGEP